MGERFGEGGGGGDPDDDDDGQSDFDGDRKRDPRPPRDFNPRQRERFDREGTHDTCGTGASQGDKFKIKREDIGIFDPHYEDPHELGVVNGGKCTIYTDVYCFTERINSFLEDENTYLSAQSQIMSFFPTLLSGAAVIWWTSEVPQLHALR
jgi:hypothetical protein